MEASVVVCKSLVELPNELILRIIAAVEFSSGNLLNVSLINYHINELMAEHRGVLLKDIARLQFPDANYLLHHGPHTLGTIQELRHESENMEKIIATAISKTKDSDKQALAARLRLGLYLLRSLATFKMAPTDQVRWAICTQVLGFELLGLIRFTAAHLMIYVRKRLENQMPEGAYDLPDIIIENKLLMDDVEDVVALFADRTHLPRHVSQPQNPHPIGGGNALPLGLRLFQQRLSFVWIKCLSEVFENIAVLSGRFSPVSDTQRAFTPGEVFENALLYELTSSDEAIYLPQDAATALDRLQRAAETFHQVASLQDPPVESSEVSSQNSHTTRLQRHLFISAMNFKWDAYLARELTAWVGNVGSPVYDPDRLQLQARAAVDELRSILRKDSIRALIQEITSRDLPSHGTFLLTRKLFKQWKEAQEQGS
jgi:hypothetical protein